MAGERITRRLKVYTTRIGIRDWAVAVPNQKEALKAWDVRENLFASGAAMPVDDPAIIAAAMRTPGVPVAAPQTKVHTSGANSHEIRSNVVRLDDRRTIKSVTRPPVALDTGRHVKTKKAERGVLSSADRTKLNEAEDKLRELDRELKAQRKVLSRRRQDLERETESFEIDVATRQRRLERELERARAAYERAKSR